MLKLFILCSAACLCCTAFSQSYDNNWVFGDSVGLNFTTGEPINFPASMWTYEACASISDASGNLLFYTNGERVWDRAHQLMANGDSLHIGGQPFPYYGSSLTQGTLILPQPDHASLYYIFQIQNYSPDNNYGIEYSVVNMNLNAGFGDVSEKNIELFETEVGEKMTAVKHGNGRDWWLMVRKWDEVADDEYDLVFTRFLITPSGIEGPFYQDIGPDSSPDDPDNQWGQMIFSPDGEKMAYTRLADIDIYSFDRCTGLFASYFTISDVDNFNTYGCSFSPDRSKLYVSGACNKNLYQYCLTCDGEPIDSTKELVYDGPTGPYCIMQHQLGPDGKIYIATCYEYVTTDIFNPKNQNLCVINNPNELYPDCDFDTNTVSLGTRRVIAGLPNMPNYNLGPLKGSECDTIGTAVNEIKPDNFKVYPNPATTTLTVQHDAGQTMDAVFIITNTTGQQVMVAPLTTSRQLIDISALPEGMYQWSVVEAGSLVQSGRLVKLE